MGWLVVGHINHILVIGNDRVSLCAIELKMFTGSVAIAPCHTAMILKWITKELSLAILFQDLITH